MTVTWRINLVETSSQEAERKNLKGFNLRNTALITKKAGVNNKDNIVMNFWLPTYIYKTLPYMCILVGIWATFSITHLLGILSGVILIVIGGFIWAMRREKRLT